MDYFTAPEIEPPEGEGVWYASEAIELVISVLRHLYPYLHAEIWAAYVEHCRRHGYTIGNASPTLGVLYQGTKRRFIRRYLMRPDIGATQLIEDLREDAIEELCRK